MKKQSTNLLIILTVAIMIVAGCKLPKLGGEKNVPVDTNNQPNIKQSPPPSTKPLSSKLIAWELGNKISIAAILYNATGNESTDSLPKAKILAREVGADIPPFPQKTGDKIKDTATILGYLLRDVGKNVGGKVKDKYGEVEAALFEMSLKTNVLLVIYVPNDSTALATAKVIRDRAKTGGLPENLWLPLVNKIEGGGSFNEIKDMALKMQTDVSHYLDQQ